MQQSFDVKNAEMLQEAMNRLHPEVRCLWLIITGLGQNHPRLMCLQEAKYHLRRCVDSGLWVPESGEDDPTDGEDDY